MQQPGAGGNGGDTAHGGLRRGRQSRDRGRLLGVLVDAPPHGVVGDEDGQTEPVAAVEAAGALVAGDGAEIGEEAGVARGGADLQAGLEDLAGRPEEGGEDLGDGAGGGVGEGGGAEVRLEGEFGLLVGAEVEGEGWGGEGQRDGEAAVVGVQGHREERAPRGGGVLDGDGVKGVA